MNLNDEVDQEDEDGSEDDSSDDEEESGDEEGSGEEDTEEKPKAGSEEDHGDEEEKDDSEEDTEEDIEESDGEEESDEDDGEGEENKDEEVGKDDDKEEEIDDSEESDGEEDGDEDDGEKEEKNDEEVGKDGGDEDEKGASEESDGEEDSEEDDGEEDSEEDDGEGVENKDEEVTNKDSQEFDAETEQLFQLLDKNSDQICNEDHERPVVDASLKTHARHHAAKRALYLCSPYLNKKTVVDSIMTMDEYKFSNYLFSMFGENGDVVFETKSGDSLIRDQMESLTPRFRVDSGVIDCWSILLNYEEKFKEPGAVSRHFFHTGCLTRNMCHGGLTWEQQCEIFDAQVAFSFKDNTDGSNLKDVDLVFFPILGSECFYVVVINLKKTAINILNNNRDETTLYEAYKDRCDLLIKLFARYLESVGHRKSQAVATAVPHIPKLKCSTTENNIEDSGIYCMHHMDMYMGEPFSKWDCEIVGNSDKEHLLLLLRVEYATKILSHELNLHARKNMKDSEEFHLRFIPVTKKEMIKNVIQARANRERYKYDV